MPLIFIFLIVFMKTKSLISPEPIHRFVLWNVGQGQWLTEITPDLCRHFDAGGEFGSFLSIKKKLLHHCAHKRNQLWLSHWDYDHFMNIPQLARHLPQLCYAYLPRTGQQKASVKKILKLNIRSCMHIQREAAPPSVWVPRKISPNKTNDSSAVFSIGPLLIPGDSPQSAEKIWSEELSLSEVSFLIAGHHGSQTSTGLQLLNRLQNLKLVLISARRKKYGHPHRSVLEKLQIKKTPVLLTEDWGHIWISL
jgi:competence protein ComEC